MFIFGFMGYKRNQVIWALWHTFAYPLLPGIGMEQVPKAFRFRVQNFIDRGLGIPERKRVRRYGVDEEYGFFETFELALALELQNLGISQLEIRSYLVSFRHDLTGVAGKLPLVAPPPRKFLIMRPRAIQEVQRISMFARPASATTRADRPLAVDDEGLKAGLQKLGAADRSRIILEIGDLATMLSAHLERAPIVKRGRR
jgi:hypothetical protein